MKADIVAKAYSDAKEHYASLGVDTEEALAHLQQYDNPYLFSVPKMEQGITTDAISMQDCIKVLLDIPGCKEQDAARFYSSSAPSIAPVSCDWSHDKTLDDKTADNRAASIITLITEARQAQKDYLLTLLKDASMLDAIYNEFCLRNNVPVADEYISDVKNYI